MKKQAIPQTLNGWWIEKIELLFAFGGVYVGGLAASAEHALHSESAILQETDYIRHFQTTNSQKLPYPDRIIHHFLDPYASNQVVTKQ